MDLTLQRICVSPFPTKDRPNSSQYATTTPKIFRKNSDAMNAPVEMRWVWKTPFIANIKAYLCLCGLQPITVRSRLTRYCTSITSALQTGTIALRWPVPMPFIILANNILLAHQRRCAYAEDAAYQTTFWAEVLENARSSVVLLFRRFGNHTVVRLRIKPKCFPRKINEFWQILPFCHR